MSGPERCPPRDPGVGVGVRKRAMIAMALACNPEQTIFDIVAEPLEVNNVCSSECEEEERVIKAISETGLRPATEYLYRSTRTSSRADNGSECASPGPPCSSRT